VEANGTGYIVTDYIEGETLDDRLKREGKLDRFHLTAILKALVEGLQHVHREDHLHRDITARSILLRKDETPVLTDFGSARQAVAARSGSIAAAVTPGYAPLEQYSIQVIPPRGNSAL
jgi:serine/threonine protein kinase